MMGAQRRISTLMLQQNWIFKVKHERWNILNGQVDFFETTPLKFELESLDGKVKRTIQAFTANRVTGSLKPLNWNFTASK